MKRLINYFKEILLTLKSIDNRLKALEKCTRSDYKTNPVGNGRILKTGSGWNP